jgi:hypothetical protein
MTIWYVPAGVPDPELPVAVPPLQAPISMTENKSRQKATVPARRGCRRVAITRAIRARKPAIVIGSRIGVLGQLWVPGPDGTIVRTPVEMVTVVGDVLFAVGVTDVGEIMQEPDCGTPLHASAIVWANPEIEATLTVKVVVLPATTVPLGVVVDKVKSG